ncbi:metallophosphoesterase [Massilia sp. YIM B02769]|uniref:metallophosphoesterase n=1 Tax=Massilia sp. YIM B02769 TaxID=3050129 RepID=UPI0025B65BC5|nr:metallophosphoesterase [Massilia sp. YIM B02769]MDN4058460.1 metallophosphoesterase [Massilia sp. YIM B02769]
MFSIILNVIGSLFHFYVAHRIYRVGPVRGRISPRAWWLGAIVVWAIYLWGVRLGDEAIDWRWWPGQFAMTWLGVLFLMTLCLLVADLLTGFGLWWRARAPRLLGIAAVAGVMVSGFAIFQAVRAPAISQYEVSVKNLPKELDGMVLVAVSDLHLGAQRRSAWMAQRVAQINALQPAAVLMVGDQVEDNPLGEPELAGVLRQLKAPRGVLAVTGNHEFYGDVDTTITEFSAGGVRWLRNEQVELAPGLLLAGVDDIGRTMRGGGEFLGGLDKVVPRDSGVATILLCHIPATRIVEGAAARGVDLMLSGHTHGGQIWPFNYLVQRQFPRYMGEYKVGDMALVVSRGAGGWGPRMRLWQPGEIVKLTLRSGS